MVPNKKRSFAPLQVKHRIGIGMVWCGLVRLGEVWYGKVRSGEVRYGPNSTAANGFATTATTLDF